MSDHPSGARIGLDAEGGVKTSLLNPISGNRFLKLHANLRGHIGNRTRRDFCPPPPGIGPCAVQGRTLRPHLVQSSQPIDDRRYDAPQ